MPSTTVVDGYTFNNWGPLTTTFTPPPSCVTGTTNIGIAWKDRPFDIQYDVQCSSVEDWDCTPTGTQSDYSRTASIPDLNPTQILEAAYYSPGLYCPSGWATVGVAARDEKSISASGILSITASPVYDAFFPQFENRATLLMDLLDPNETAVMCCPSSMTADLKAGCYSTLPNYKPSVGCYELIPVTDMGGATKTVIVNGTTHHQLIQTLVDTLPMTSSETTTFDGYDVSTLVGVTWMPIVTLIHQAKDLEAAETGSVSSSATSQPVAISSSAARRAPALSVWDGLLPVIEVSLAAMGLGAAIIL
ncbi:uncharacterized protein N7483_004108 [Penicillium malachiteum]|uniref:uncharacterized protein n=1 Tax=Penicillium malachiteum TaxID=1324776 RepID=UPI0025469EB2|nr:uncharacterized protein N7483_004108 [Penicillium malachiteum]KAJ5729600.1 hypothetical protein N7483_004108 [Penicillium malachiteum]